MGSSGSARDLRLYLAGEVTSAFGSSLTTAATAVIAVIRLHAGPGQISLIVLSGTLPALLLGPLCGVLADRVNRPRRVLAGMNIACAAAALGCGLAALTGVLTIAWLCGLDFILGVCGIMVEGLYFAHLRNLDVGDLSQARGQLQSGESFARTAAASVAGPIAAFVGTAVLFVGDAATYVISALCLRGLRTPDGRAGKPLPRASLRREFADGLAAIRGHGLLSAYLTYACLVNVAASGIATQRAVFVLDDLRVPVFLYTIPGLVASLIGGVASLFGVRVLKRVSPRRVLIVCSVAGPACGALLPATAGPLPAIVLLIATATTLPLLFGMISNLALVSIVSDDIGDRYFGRVSGLLATACTVSSCVGTVFGGIEGTRLGARDGIWVFEGVYALAVTALVVGLRRRAGRLTQETATTAAIPAPQADAQVYDLAYPQTRRGADAEDFHGVQVADPYRWLEDPAAPDTQRWMAEQGALSAGYLAALPGRHEFEETVRSLVIGPTESPEKMAGTRRFRVSRATASGDWQVEVRDPDGEWRVAVDPATLGEAAVIRRWEPSPTGRYLAVQATNGGDESATPLSIIDVDAGLVTEMNSGTRYSQVIWLADERQYYYVRAHDGRPGTGVYLHSVATDPAADLMIIGDEKATTRYAVRLWHGRWLAVTVRQGTARDTAMHIADMANGGTPVRIPVAGTGAGVTIDRRGALIFPVFDGAGFGTVVRVRPAQDAEAGGGWEQPQILIAEGDAMVASVSLIPTSQGDRLVLLRSRDGVSLMSVHDPATGALLTEVDLPGRGTITGISQTTGEATLAVSYTDWTTPLGLWHVDLWTGRMVPEKEEELPNLADVQATAVTYESEDGTSVPLTILSLRGAPAGPKPALLTGYGGFGISFRPTFQPDLLAWVSCGGIVAVAGVRGGGERGRGWHADGSGTKKANAFTDLHAAASWLIREGWTEPGRLAVLGGSNGGMLAVGAMVQRPDTYAAVVGWAAPLDMIRYERSGLGKSWRKEYGTPDDPESFRALISYSPYHNAARTAAYPAVLLGTGTSDSRVDPSHSRKMAAQLQHANAAGGPVLLRIVEGAGHTSGGSQDPAEGAATVLSFLAHHTGLSVGV
jgi:prolyl oligopeptidase